MKITFRDPKFYGVLTSTLVFGLLSPAFSETESQDSVQQSSATNLGKAELAQESKTASNQNSTDKATGGPTQKPAADLGVNETAAGTSASSAVHDKQEDIAHPPPEVPARKSVTLKGNQKLKIAGFSEGKESQVVDKDSLSDPPEYHRVQMRLSGSMCFACLHTFEERLKAVYGVERVKITKSTQMSVQSYSPDLSNWADAVIFYDAHRVDLPDIRAFSKFNGYTSYRVLDKVADALPAPEKNESIWSKKL